tara:strand:+ start:120 stop:614 length:495 start_codon:yes stop_codon:yes gene_type:complete
MMEIRTENPSDCETISRITRAAFAPMPFSEGNEAECIEKLRRDGDLTLSLVAINDAELVGHIAFSPVFINESFDGWYGLGPVSASPDAQRTGIGSALINEGLARLRQMDAQGCALIGDPAYYSRFGFVGDGRLSYRNLSARIVQWLAFKDTKPSGVLRYSPGLE